MSWPLPSVTILIISAALIFADAAFTSWTFNFLPMAVLPVPSGRGRWRIYSNIGLWRLLAPRRGGAEKKERSSDSGVIR